MKFQLNNDGYITETAFGKLHVAADETLGFRPFQLMVSSIAVCSGTVMNKILKKKRLDVQDIQIEADVTRNPDEADRIEKIALHFKVEVPGLTEKAMEQVMKLTEKNCSMVQSVKGSIEITETYELI